MHKDREHQFSQDQASRLRELAEPAIRPDSGGAQPNVPQQHSPRVTMLSELPATSGCIQLAWHLAKGVSDSKHRSLIVDLSPSASRLPTILKDLIRLETSGAVPDIQPLWHQSPHGKTLAAWRPRRNSHIDLVAQPSGEVPTAEQMPRICEQLVRQIAKAERQPDGAVGGLWSWVFFISESGGIPLDSACWEAADEILLAYPDDEAARQQVISAIQARLPRKQAIQRLVLLLKQTPSIRDWPAPKKLIRAQVRPAAGGLLLPESTDAFRLLWPPEGSCSEKTMRNNRWLARAANLIAGELRQTPLPFSSRQAC